MKRQRKYALTQTPLGEIADSTNQQAVSNDFLSLLNELTNASEQDTGNRRKRRRAPRSVSLRIQPLDLDFCPDGDPFWAVSRDISSVGLGFLNGEPLQHEFVRIGLFDQTATMIARVCHSTSIGVKYPLYLVGVQFLDEYYE